MGANLGGWGECIPQYSGSIPPHVFFGLHFIFGKKMVICESDDPFFFDFTSFWAKNWASARVCQIIAPISKNDKKWSIWLNRPRNTQHRFASLPKIQS